MLEGWVIDLWSGTSGRTHPERSSVECRRQLVECGDGEDTRRGAFNADPVKPDAAQAGRGCRVRVEVEPVADVCRVRGLYSQTLAGEREDRGVGLGHADLAGCDDYRKAVCEADRGE